MGDSYRTAGRGAGRKIGALFAVAAMTAGLSACGLGDDATALGKPCSLLKADEIQTALGQAVKDGTQAQNVCDWATDGGGKFSAGISGGGSGLFDSALRTAGGTAVSGVGDKATYAGIGQYTFIQVLKGQTNLRLDYTGPGAPDEAKMTDLARKAVSRL